MKLNKKKVFVTALALSLIAILSMGTIAWFTDADKVTNEFYFADSEDTTPDDIFSVDVWEENISGEVTDEGIEYKDILPGDTRVKKAYVKNTGHYDQYIRVIVEISDADVWQAALGEKFENYLIESCFVGFDATKWNNTLVEVTTDNTIKCTLYYNEILPSEGEIQLFEKVKVPTELTQEMAAYFDGSFTIDVKAQAVQTENVGESAYEAFQTVGM